MSAKTIKAFQAHMAANGKATPKVDVYRGVWSDRYKGGCAAHKIPTVRPPAPDVTPKSLRELAAEMRADASRWLARANDLEDAAKRLEGE